MITGDELTGGELTGDELTGDGLARDDLGSRGAVAASGATLRAGRFASADHLDPSVSQQRVLEHAASDPGPLLVYGGPSTGKTTLTVELAVRHLEAEHGSHRLTVLSPSRVAAARVRESMAR
ncbi:MAG TPA: AAA family ATPase, partial [Candidatus Nesterenkonia stercoripullorum]|nr:AAA family ATPase [Candidatus Nesterenkonia stercoripullorum]